MKPVIKYGMIYTSIFAAAVASGFALQYKPTKSNKPKDIEIPLTAGERLINSVLSYEAMDLTANIRMVTEDNTLIEIDFLGQGSIRDFENIQVAGALDLNLDGALINADLSYFKDTLAFHINDNYFKLKTDELMSFIDMIPTYGVKMELPEDIKDISLDSIEEEILSIKEEDKKTLPEGGYYYTMSVGELELYVKTDEEDNLLGLRTDSIFYKGMNFKLDVDLKSITLDKMSIVNPLETEEASKYQDFEPIFGLFDSAMNFVKKDSATINVAFGLDKINKDELDNETVQNLLATSININYNKTLKSFSLNGDIYENGRTHSFLAAYENETIYASFHKVNISIQTSTIYDLLNYIFEKITDGKDIKDLLGGAMEGMSSFDLNDIVNKVKNTLGHVSISEQEFTVDLDLSSFDLESKPFQVTLSWDDTSIKTLTIHDLTVKNFTADLVLTFSDYAAPIFDKRIFVAIEPAAPLVSAILDLIDDTQFRIEFDAIVDKTDEAEKDITIDGGLQFDIENELGYGELNIVDGDSYLHNIKADMFDKDTFFFSYNHTLNGKFSSKTITDLITLVTDVINSEDAHFVELFGDLLNGMEGSPIDAIMNGEIGALLEHDIISDLQITDTYISCNISLELAGIDKSINIRIEYEGNVDTGEATLNALKISGIELDDATISANIYLKKFNPVLESTRLSPYDEYLDFSDIKVLLELGLNTSKFNYYHFTATAKVKLIGVLLGTTLFEKDIPLDIKIRNEKGNVKLAVEFTDLPIVAIATPNDDYASEKDRKASIYYYEDTIYVKRTEQVKKKGFLGIGTGNFMTYTLTRTCDTQYFFDNILEILLGDVLSCSSTIMNLITDSDDTSTGESQMHYEKIINDFQYNEVNSFFYIDLNLAEIAHDNMFTVCTAKIYENPETKLLSGVDAKVTLNLKLIKIGLELELKMVNDYKENIWTFDEEGNITGDEVGTTLTLFEAYIAQHKDDVRNERFITVQ